MDLFIILAFYLNSVLSQKALQRSDKLSFANWRSLSNSKLEVLPHEEIKEVIVQSEGQCLFECLNNGECISMNVEETAAKNAKKCRLLRTDIHHSEKGSLLKMRNFKHLSIETPCKSYPCLNNGKCNPDYARGKYHCSCTSGYSGKNCEKVKKAWEFAASSSGRHGTIQQIIIPVNGLYTIECAGARGGNHSTNYGTYPGTFYGGKGAVVRKNFSLSSGDTLNIVVGQRGGNSVEVKGGQRTSKTAAELGLSVENNAATGGGGGTFVYNSRNELLVAAGGGGGASAGFNGVDGQCGTSGADSVGRNDSQKGFAGSSGQPGSVDVSIGNYHGGVGTGWLGMGSSRKGLEHGEAGGSRAQGWVGGRTGTMNSGNNGGPAPGAVGGFGGGGGGSEDNGASGGGGGYSGGGAGTHSNQAGGGGGSYCGGSDCCSNAAVNSDDNGYVKVKEL